MRGQVLSCAELTIQDLPPMAFALPAIAALRHMMGCGEIGGAGCGRAGLSAGATGEARCTANTACQDLEVGWAIGQH